MFLSADQRNLLSKITFHRFWNGLLLWASFHFSTLTKRNFHCGKAISLAIEPTTSCNLRCPECPSGLRSFSRPTGMLNPVFFEKIINETKSHLYYLTFYFQGEPYLNPHFLDMVAYAKKYKIYTSTSTNAHYLTSEIAKKTVQSGLDRLIVSLDGTTQQTYQHYRIGGSIQKVEEGVKEIVKWKKQLKSQMPYIRLQFLVVKPNEHQIEEARQLCQDWGADDIVFKTAQIYDYENGSPFIPDNEHYARYVKRGDKYVLKNKLLNQCWKMWHSSVITWDGKVVPCCFDKDAAHTLGNVSVHSFQKAWKSEGYQQFRSSLLRGRSQIAICKNCTEGTSVFGGNV